MYSPQLNERSFSFTAGSTGGLSRSPGKSGAGPKRGLSTHTANTAVSRSPSQSSLQRSYSFNSSGHKGSFGESGLRVSPMLLGDDSLVVDDTMLVQQTVPVRRKMSKPFNVAHGKDDGAHLVSTHSATSTTSAASAASAATITAGSGANVVHFGEVISSTGLLRGKKTDFVVLTENEIQRFKSRTKAAEHYPTLFNVVTGVNIGQGVHVPVHGSVPDGAGALQDHRVCTYDRVFAVHEPTPLHIQIDYVDEATWTNRSAILQLSTRPEAETWTRKLHSLVADRTVIAQTHFVRTLANLREYLKLRHDLHEPTFRVFRISMQTSHPKAKNSSSSEEVSKMTANHYFLVFGHYNVHILSPNNALATSFTPISTHGILSLVHIAMSPRDATFYLSFRVPFKPLKTLEMASYAAADIIQLIRAVNESLRPCWSEFPVAMDIPELLQDEPLQQIDGDDDINDLSGFRMTLAAYCAAYGLAGPERFHYSIYWDPDNGLAFKLLPSRSKREYSILEYLALFRTLRWNESFGLISFGGNSLNALHGLMDQHASIELSLIRTANGRRLTKSMKAQTVLKLELQLLMLSSTKLRKLDLSGCIGSPGSAATGAARDGTEKGTGIIDALMAVCKKGTSNVDSFVFSNMQISINEFDYLVDVASAKSTHLRSLEIARCGLYERELTLLIQALEVHENTLEGLDISDNPGRISPYALNDSLYRFQCMRYLSLQRLSITSEVMPLLTEETLTSMHLQRLRLDGTRLNDLSVESLADYLTSAKSSALVQLSIQGCGLSGGDLCTIMHAVSGCSGRNPEMKLYIGDNSISEKFADFMRGFSQLSTKHLSMTKVEFRKEAYFCEFLSALVKSKLTRLDLSQLLIPDDASYEACELVADVFKRNHTLVELNLDGETSKLQVARIGHGLGRSLAGLAENSTLKVLHVCGNELGIDGAMVLAKALNVNTTLEELYIDDNNLSLQGFTAIVNSLTTRNATVKRMPYPDVDRKRQFASMRNLGDRLDTEITALSQKMGKHGPSRVVNGDHGDLKAKAESKRKVQETMALLEEEWNKVYGLLAARLKQNQEEWSRRSSIDEAKSAPLSRASSFTHISRRSSDDTGAPKMEVISERPGRLNGHAPDDEDEDEEDDDDGPSVAYGAYSDHDDDASDTESNSDGVDAVDALVEKFYINGR
ncbi:uncharacterized protein V1510DRAFT_421748 [Dipodascopsis tothii]|uniref:uncharacterized protein n=1 Tax=Dipodascopsis tothii TaxID=44089 RepID=UPI0034CEFD18